MSSLELTNHQYCEQTKKLKEAIEENFLVLGQRLKVIRDEQRFFPQHDSFASFCDDMKLAESVASRLISIYQTFVLDWEIAPELLLEAGGWSRLDKIRRVAASRPEAEDLIQKSALMGGTDFEREITEKKRGVSQADCAHEMVTIRYCKKCHVKVRTYDQD